MKKLKALRIVAAIVTAILWAFLNATMSFSKNISDDVPICIQPKEQSIPGNPRGPVFNPFTAYRMNNTVVLESDTSYGMVGITLVSTAGDYVTTVFDTADSSILIPISGNAGNYTLLLTDSTGAQFIGTFEI